MIRAFIDRAFDFYEIGRFLILGHKSITKDGQVNRDTARWLDQEANK